MKLFFSFRAGRGCLLVLALLVSTSASPRAQPPGGDVSLLKDDFASFAGNSGNRTTGGWESDSSDGGCLPPSLTDVAGVRCLRMSWDEHHDQQRNGFIARHFTAAVKHRLVLSFKMLHTNGRMGQYAGVFNADRSKGYAVFWSAGDAPTNGTVQILRFDGTAPIVWSARGPAIATVKGGDVAHGSQQPPLAAFELIVDQSAGSIELSIDGAKKATVVDSAPFQDLQWVVLRGNGAGLFGDVSLVENK